MSESSLKDFPGRIFVACQRVDDKEKDVATTFVKDTEKFKIALAGYTDLTVPLDTVKKSLD